MGRKERVTVLSIPATKGPKRKNGKKVVHCQNRGKVNPITLENGVNFDAKGKGKKFEKHEQTG